MSNKRILFAGESWNTYGVHTKGASSYTTSGYEEGARALLRALKGSGFDITYLRNHEAVEGFPYTTEEIAERFDVVVLSDIPADSLLAAACGLRPGRAPPEQAALAGEIRRAGRRLADDRRLHVVRGLRGPWALCVDSARGRTARRDRRYDDRIEEPEGVNPVVAKDHPILNGIDGELAVFPRLQPVQGQARQRGASVGRQRIHSWWSESTARAALLPSPPTARRIGEARNSWRGGTIRPSGRNWSAGWLADLHASSNRST